MVTITNYFEQVNAQGETFISLELSGDLELMQSSITRKMYATTRKCRINSTLTKEVAERMVGTHLDGTLQRVEIDPYDFVRPDTGEVLKLAHRYEYKPAGSMQLENSAQVLKEINLKPKRVSFLKH